MTASTGCDYSLYDLSVSGEVRRIAEVRASTYRQALHEARRLLPDGPGELRVDGRVICRFGRAKPFMLQR
jgi:hypothetical protein